MQHSFSKLFEIIRLLLQETYLKRLVCSSGRNLGRDTKRYVISNKYDLIVLIAGVSLYSTIYSVITLLKFYTYNATVADLGINSGLLYGVFHGDFTLTPGNRGFINTGKLIYLLIAPVYNLYPKEQVLIVFQTVWISLGSVPIYFLARRRIGDGFPSVAIALAWLLYYPMAGVNWFDFHFMAIFPTLFLAGEAFLENGRYRLSLLCFSLATITDFLIPLVMIIFSLFIILDRGQEKDQAERKKIAFALISLSTIILVVTNYFFGLSYTFSYIVNRSAYDASFYSGIWYTLSYFIWMVFPLIFAPLLYPKRLILLLPFLALALLSMYRPYVETMFEQYASLTSPIIFIAGIHGLERLKIHGTKGAVKQKISIRRFAAGILLASSLMAMLFTPAGNILTAHLDNPEAAFLLTGNIGNYNTASEIAITNQDLAISWMVSLIPPGTSVMAQNNIPQLYQGYTFLWPGNILHNSTTISLPDYAIVDPYNVFYNHPVFPGESPNITAENAFNQLLGTGLYGIYAEYQGIELIELGFHGAPLIYSPSL